MIFSLFNRSNARRQLLIYALSGLCFGSCSIAVAQQMGDPDFEPDVTAPSYPYGKGPVVVIDGAHSNFHKAEERYKPFADLLRADGYRVDSNALPFTREDLDIGMEILVIANALHPSNDRNWRLPTPSAFTSDEIRAINEWVKAGGSLLLIADHMPFPGAARDLAETFGFQFNNGFAFGPEKGGETRFDRETGTLKEHEITSGKTPDQKINHVVTFTGQAFKGPPKASPLLVFGEGFYSQMPEQAWKFDESTTRVDIDGWLQGAALEYGKGRVCVFGEAAGFTAQVTGAQRRKIGMNAEEASDNAQFVLNVLHWLSASLSYEYADNSSNAATQIAERDPSLPKGYFEFHDAAGRAVVAKVIECDTKSGMANLQLENGHHKKVHANIFSDEGRVYLKQWCDCRELLSKRLKIEVENSVTERNKNTYSTNRASGEKRLFLVTTYQDITPEIHIHNHTQVLLENIKVEWCMYYTQEERGHRKPGDSGIIKNEVHNRCEKGQSFIRQLNSSETQHVRADPYTVFNTSLERDLSPNAADRWSQEGKTEGVWIKLSILLPDGTEVMREYCEPENIRELGWKL